MVDEVWKQQTLLQLLQIVELPVLDCILVSPGRVRLQACRASLANQDLVISNTCLERELPNILNLPQSVHVKHFCFGFDPCCVSSMQFYIHRSDHLKSTMFCLQVGWVAVCSRRLLRTVSRPADCVCRRAAQPSWWRLHLRRSVWRADDKPEETAL